MQSCCWTSWLRHRADILPSILKNVINFAWWKHSTSLSSSENIHFATWIHWADVRSCLKHLYSFLKSIVVMKNDSRWDMLRHHSSKNQSCIRYVDQRVVIRKQYRGIFLILPLIFLRIKSSHPGTFWHIMIECCFEFIFVKSRPYFLENRERWIQLVLVLFMVLNLTDFGEVLFNIVLGKLFA